MGNSFLGLSSEIGQGGWETQTHLHLPILFHLYDGQGLLIEDEELDYRTAKEMAGYRITPNQRSTPRPEARPKAAQLGEEEEPKWVARPFAAVNASLRQAKKQYLGVEEALEEISAELGVEPK